MEPVKKLSKSRTTARLAIFGSCVSRDTFTYLDPEIYTLAAYVARQSVISTTRRPLTFDLDLTSLPSAFQRRITRGSLSGNGLEVLAAARPDAILWDLTDERTGVFELPDRTYITKTVELDASRKTPLIRAATSRHLTLGSDEHFELWSQCVREFVRAIRERIGVPIILIAPPWAKSDDTGHPSPPSYGVEAEEGNQRLVRYVDLAERLTGIERVTTTHVLTGSDNRWGPAPFHYTEAVYRDLAHRLDALLARTFEKDQEPPKNTTSGGTDHGVEWLLSEVASPEVLLVVVENRSPGTTFDAWETSTLTAHSGISVLFLNDPTPNSEENPSTGWGLGAVDSPGIKQMERALIEVGGPLHLPTVIYGHGQSGFVALQLAIRVRSTAAILSNPDLGWWDREAPRQIAALTLGDREPDEEFRTIKGIAEGKSSLIAHSFFNTAHPQSWYGQASYLCELLESNIGVDPRRSTTTVFHDEVTRFQSISTEKIIASVRRTIKTTKLEQL